MKDLVEDFDGGGGGDHVGFLRVFWLLVIGFWNGLFLRLANI